MRYEVALTWEANTESREHLLQHFKEGVPQEDLCFALWRPSTGKGRYTALIYKIILPEEGERSLHGNASLEPSYIARGISLARQHGSGVALMHSHPSGGWQGMSGADVAAERDVLGYPAGATGLPLVGLTIGTDGYWSSRFWIREQEGMTRNWCAKTRVVGPKSYSLYYNDHLNPPGGRREVLRRTYDAWGHDSQNAVSRLRVGIVGLGSVGCIVAEAVARIGVGQLTLIDPDKVEEHNLDRLLYGTVDDIGRSKVELASEFIQCNATAEDVQITELPISVHERDAYESALDCDVIFSCVDRPLARDVLNYISQAHMIPVIDGGVSIETDPLRDRLFSAHWRSYLITPYSQCLQCSGQYSSSEVVLELDGSLDDPCYIKNMPKSEQVRNQNVFPFSLSVAGLEVNMMLRYLLSLDWWPPVAGQDYQFLTGKIGLLNEKCQPNCAFLNHRIQGDMVEPFYLRESLAEPLLKEETLPKPKSIWQRFLDVLRRY